jgi:hypothetical protein
VDFVQLLELPFLPALAVDLRVEEVNPLLPAFDLSALEPTRTKLLRDTLPTFGGELGVEDR